MSINGDLDQVKPPRWAQRLIEWYCKPALAEDLIGDLNEYFERNVETKGPFRAKLIYVIDAIKFLRPYTAKTPKIFQPFIHWIMIGSYLKTSARNLVRNKLFSSINIVGLAISMSVGLLMIAFLGDMFSYDRFHEKGSRIYRVISQPRDTDGTISNQFASTSARAGRLIREKISGVEELTVLRQSFESDAHIDDKVIPMTAIWAESSIFDVFTFPMVKGNQATALNEPYSIVLTQKSANKLFGSDDVLGRSITFDTTEYHVTGVIKDIPFFSHLRFESLISFSTAELDKNVPNLLKWNSIWQNYVYLVLPEDADLELLQSNLDVLCDEENAGEKNLKVFLSLQPLNNVVLGPDLSNSFGAAMPVVVVWIIGGLALIVILSACFNYTNLSIARSMRRFKEIGLRKAIGAGRNHVRQQFIFEAIIISLAALVLASGIFLIIREQFMNMAPELSDLIQLRITPVMITSFIAFAIIVGVVAGFLPAVFFARVGIMQALRDVSSVKVFRHISMRKALVIVQYTLTLIFITATFVGYRQYRNMLAFDLGFKTTNIFNIPTQGNETAELTRKLSQIPEIGLVSQSMLVTSTGSFYGDRLRYPATGDSLDVGFNEIDENYFPMHGHKFVVGGNFVARPTTKEAQTEVIVTEKTVRDLNIAGGDPLKAIGESVRFNKVDLSIVGVLKDFHYGTVQNELKPIIFVYRYNKRGGILSMEIRSDDIIATRAKIEQTWNEFDKVHPFEGQFYEEQIERAYGEINAMLKVIGFLSFLAISIASMGMFGMVVFTTETKLKEISIRKVLGASSRNLIYLMSRGFFVLLIIAAAIAIPLTWAFFDQVVLPDVAYHAPIGMFELFAGLIGVLMIAIIMIGSQTLKAARTNPAEVLKSE